jgi:hypothetical protein
MFRRDDAFQREMRDRLLAPYFYEHYYAGHYEFLHHTDPRGADTVVHAREGDRLVEEKIVRWPVDKTTLKPWVPRLCGHSALALETDSCTVEGHEKSGWMDTSNADYLLYGFATSWRKNALVCYLIEMQPLKQWFWPRVERFAPTVTDQINRSRCRVVPIDDIMESGVWIRRYQCEMPPGDSYCEICHAPGPFGFGVNLRAGTGRFYCRAHREEGAKRNGATIRR